MGNDVPDDAESEEVISMPFWCGYWGAAAGGFWWILPVLGLVVMAVMLFACSRGFGCMGRRTGRGAADVAELRRELQDLKEDVRTLLQQPR